MRFETYYLL